MARLKAAHVLVVGVGGVGSWCAEALVRTGVGHMTLVDDDRVVESNVNRQCPATSLTLGRPKVEAMAERLCAINPQADVRTRVERFEGVESFEGFDVVVDAIDSVDCKAELILSATEAGVPIVSSMGAALRLDPTKVTVTRFEKVEGDGLARALRQRFKKLQRFPTAKFSCVWSTEQLQDPIVGAFPRNAPQAERRHSLLSAHFEEMRPHEGDVLQLVLSTETQRHGEKGSLMPVTATFGMCLASEAIRILTKGEQ